MRQLIIKADFYPHTSLSPYCPLHIFFAINRDAHPSHFSHSLHSSLLSFPTLSHMDNPNQVPAPRVRRRNPVLVQNYAEEEYVDANGDTQRKLKCLKCNKYFPVRPGAGTGHLMRHIAGHERMERAAM